MANPVIKGIHHITLCASGAQEDVDFCTQVLGQRLIKQTVLFDGRYAHYHLYYANANAEVGSVLTTFPYKRVPGRKGSGQISSTAYTAPKGAIKFWKDHLDRHKVEHSGILERFGQSFIRFKHPSGLLMEAIEDPADKRTGWTTDQISSDVSLGGFHGPVLSVRETPEQERFFIDALGFRKTGVDGAYHRFEIGEGGAAKTLVLYHEPDRPAGSWGFGAGTGPSPGARHRHRRGAGGTEESLRRTGLHRLLRNQGSLLLPLDLRAVSCRHPGRMRRHGRRGVPEGRIVRGARDAPAAAALVRARAREGLSRCSNRSSCRRPIGRRVGVKGPVLVPKPDVSKTDPNIAVSRRTDATFIGGDR